MAVAAASDGGQRFQFVKQKAAVYKITSFVRRTLTCRAACHLPPPRCDTKFLVRRTEEASFIFLPAASSSSPLAAAASLTRKLYVLSSPFLSRKPRRQWLAGKLQQRGTIVLWRNFACYVRLCIGLTLSNLEFDSWMRLAVGGPKRRSTHSFCQDEVRLPRPSDSDA